MFEGKEEDSGQPCGRVVVSVRVLAVGFFAWVDPGIRDGFHYRRCLLASCANRRRPRAVHAGTVC